MEVAVLRGVAPHSGSGDGDSYGYGYGDGDGYGDGYGSGYGSGDGSGYGDGDGSGSGYGDGSGYGYGYGDGSGSGDGDGYGSGSGDGSGYGDGYGDGSGYGYGDGEYWADALGTFLSRLPIQARERARALAATGARLGYWRSSSNGTAVNGGRNHPVQAGTIERERGPLREDCGVGQLHATLRPEKWKGDRWWIVALIGEVRGDDQKMWALEREVIGECQ